MANLTVHLMGQSNHTDNRTANFPQATLLTDLDPNGHYDVILNGTVKMGNKLKLIVTTPIPLTLQTKCEIL